MGGGGIAPVSLDTPKGTSISMRFQGSGKRFVSSAHLERDEGGGLGEKASGKGVES